MPAGARQVITGVALRDVIETDFVAAGVVRGVGRREGHRQRLRRAGGEHRAGRRGVDEGAGHRRRSRSAASRRARCRR